MAQDAIAKYKTVAIGGSAGSLDVILQIIAAIPASTKTSFIIVTHRKNDSDSMLDDLLSSRTSLNVRDVEDKDEILPGCIYLAPPDYHLLLENETMFALDTSERVHFSRPSIDVTFESVAEVIGASAAGILLSGANADGAEGLNKIKQAGGFTIVQDPASAEVSFMPQQAIDTLKADLILDSNEITKWIAEHC
jgi:two-component system chemotaxis response regulator CheB